MFRSKRIVLDSFSAILATGLTATAQWLLFLIPGRVLGPEAGGRVALAAALVNPLVQFSGLQLRSLQATDTTHEYSASQYARLRYLMTTGAALALLAYHILTTPNSPTITLALAFWRLTDMLAEGPNAELYRAHQIRVASLLSIIRTLTPFSVYTTLLIQLQQLELALSSAAAVAGLLLGAEYLVQSRLPTTRQNGTSKSHVFRLLRLSFPLGLVIGIVTLLTQLPRYFLAAFLDEATVGIYATLTSLLGIGSILVTVLGQVLTPRFRHQLVPGAGLPWLAKTYLWVALTVGLASAACTIVFGRTLLRALLPGAAVDPTTLFLAAITAPLLYVSGAAGTLLTTARIIDQQLALNVLYLIAMAVLCLLLIPSGGLPGALFALLALTTLQLSTKSYLLSSFSQTTSRRLNQCL